jgi:hypothetical protein
VVGIRLAVAHALEDHRPTFPDSLLWPDRFILERLAGPMLVSTDAFEESCLTAAVGVAAMTGCVPARAPSSAERPLMTVGTARARKMNPVKAVSKEVVAGGNCR